MKYKLIFYNNESKEELFSCSTDGTSDIKDAVSAIGNGQITNLNYTKDVYCPCHVEACLSITPASVSSEYLQELFINKVCKLCSYGADSTEHVIGSNYYVHNVKTKLVFVNGEKQKNLFLSIYSMDKLLDIIDECHSYVGKHLCSSILTEGVERYTKGTGFTITTNAGVEKLQFLKSTNGYEFIQPYIVQYNETFYSMLARTANRCGEYMYFEDGKLNVGSANPEALTINDNTELSVRYPKVSVESIFNDIKYFTRSYSKTDGDSDSPKDLGDITSAPECVGTTGFEYNPDKKPSASFITDYSIPVDEYLMEYTKGEYDTRSCGGYTVGVEGLSMGLKFLNTPGPFLEAAALVGLAAGMKVVDMQVIQSSANSAMDNNISDMSPYATKEEEYTDTSDNNKKRLFSSVDGSGEILKNLNYNGFTAIRRCEEKLADERLVMELDTAKNTTKFLLGRKITYDNTEYVVAKVEGKYNGSTFTEHIEAVPAMKIGSTTFYIPPMIPAGHVRYAEPQTAKVKNSMDPQDMGRVRISYGWQDNDSVGDCQTASPFIRVATPFAAKGGGVFFQLAENEEVMIKYDHGNVERPYVSCSLYNGKIKPSLGKDLLSPITREIRSQNGHKIIFTDLDDIAFGTGAVGLKVPGATSLINEYTSAASDGSSRAGGVTISDALGFYSIKASSDQRLIALQSALGSISLNAFSSISIGCPYGDLNIYGKNVSIKARNKVNIQSGIALYQNFLQFGDKATLQDFVGSIIKDFIIDLSIVRTCLERILEPVNGSCYIDGATDVKLSEGIKKPKQWKDFWKDFGKSIISSETDNNYWDKEHRFKDVFNQRKQTRMKLAGANNWENIEQQELPINQVVLINDNVNNQEGEIIIEPII